MSQSYLRHQLSRSLVIAKKNLLVYYARGPVVIQGILIPSFLFAAWSVARPATLSELVPGMAAMSVFFTSTAIGPAIAPWETRMRTLERIATAPLSTWSMILGDTLACVVFGSTTTGVVVLLVTLGGGIPMPNPLLLTTAVPVAAFGMAALGLLLSSPPTNTPSNVMMLSSLVKFPLIFISGVLIPLENLPEWARSVSFVSPLTYFTDLAREAFGHSAFFPSMTNLLILLLTGAVLFLAAVLAHRATLPRRL